MPKPSHTIVAAMAATLVACGNGGATFCGWHSLSDDGWRRTDTARFTIVTPAATGTTARTGELRLRVAEGFPYNSLTLVVTGQAGGRQLQCDTIECRVADERGRLYGHGTGLHTYTFPVTIAAAPAADTLSFTIHHIMRRETLPAVAAVGLAVER